MEKTDMKKLRVIISKEDAAMKVKIIQNIDS